MENLDILWLDDQRNPNTYFKKKPTKEEGTLFRNLTYYKNNIFNRYNVTFRWAHSYEDFIKEITTKMPDFISFDYDLKNGRSNVEGKLPNGIDCAKWLMEYCKENGIPMPKSYVHSANPKHGPELNSLLGLTENKKRTIRLTESKLKNIITECVREALRENEEIIDEGLFDNIRDTYHDMVTSRVNPEKYQRYRQNRNYQDAMNAQQQGTNLSASQKGTLRRGDEKLAQRKANTQKMLTRARSEYIDTENGRSNPYRTDATARTAQRARSKYQTYQNRNNDIQGNNNPY